MVPVNKQEADQSKKHRKLHSFFSYFGIKKTDWYFLTVDRSLDFSSQLFVAVQL